MTNEEIQEFVSLNSEIKKIITSKVISDLENILQPDEILLKAVQGKPHTAILLSNTRLIIITNGVFGIKIESEYFNAIKSATHKNGLVSASIQIQASQSRTYPVDQPKGLQFIEALNAKLAQKPLNNEATSNQNKKSEISSFLVFIALAVVVFAFYVNSKEDKITNENSIAAPQTTSNAEKWYEGGTLHGATVHEFNQANFANKLATCGDYVARLWNEKLFTKEVMSKIKSINDIKPYAYNCLEILDNYPDEKESIATAFVFSAALEPWFKK